MKIDDIEAFEAVVRCQSLSQAAEVLSLTQPAITRRIQSFEEALGVVLLDRNTKPPKPTAAGLLVYEQCRVVLSEVEALRELATQDLTPAGGLRLGLTQGLGDILLSNLLQTLKKTYPDLDTNFSTDWGNLLVEKVEQGKLDAATVLMPSNRLAPRHAQARSLARARLVVVAAKDSITKRSPKLADLYESGWILNPDGCGFRASLQRVLAAQGLPLRVVSDTFGRELQLQLVSRGLGLGLMPEPLLAYSSYRDKLDVLSISDFKQTIDLWLVHRERLGSLQAPVEQFAQLVTEAFQRDLRVTG
ncbi:MAG TPA: LysR family transcriptional regulator [Rhodocyclaceae bacterium]|nr:LysR family transcriptional regulator [Rhodocyclaceae bacterium]